MRQLVPLLLCVGLLQSARAQTPEVRLNIDPAETQVLINGKAFAPQGNGRYAIGQQDFGRNARTPQSVLLRSPGFQEKSLGVLTYNSLKRQSGPYQLAVANPLGLMRRYPGLVLLGFLASLFACASLLNLRRQRLESLRRITAMGELYEAEDFRDPLVGTRLQGYELLSRLGQGGMASVYRAVPVDRVDRSEVVAIKIIRPDQISKDFQARFQREIRVSARLDHPNVLRVIDWGQDGAITYLVMELVEGTTLTRLIPAGGLPLARGLEYIGGVIEGLAYAHSRGIVHRDLKPENVMVTSTGRVKLMDFGLARSREVKTVTLTGSVMGTPAYMAPEQVLNGPSRGALTDRSDQYALAVLIYEVLSGRRPFEGDDPMALIMSHINDPPASLTEFLPDIPVKFADVLLKMLAKSPRERFETVKAAGCALLKAAGPLPPATTIALQNLEALQQPLDLPETVEVL